MGSDMGGSTSADMGSSPNSGGPRILSFGTNVTELTDGETVRFVAVLTEPSGLDKLVGGQLISPDGAIKYGAFVAAQQGSYSLDLLWSQISQAKQINFATEEKRVFVGEFFNIAGQKTSMPIELRLHCKGGPACEGRCVNTGSTCPSSTDKLCIAGACKAGCYVSNTFYAVDQMSPTNACQACKPAVSKTALQTLPNYEPCMTGLTCGAGKCEVPFARQDSKSVRNLNSVAAPSAMVQVAVGDAGTIVRTTDGGANWATANSTVTDALTGVFAVSATEFYAAGLNGTILKSTDAGATWAKQTSGTNAFLTGVWASSSTDVWVVGSDGIILRTSNGGATWVKRTDSNFLFHRAIWGSSATDVYIAASGGQILRTTNGGSTYTVLSTGAGADLQAVWGSGAADVYVAGVFGTVLRSTNGGASWTKLTSPVAGSIVTGVWGSGANNVYFVTFGGGGIWRTTNSSTLTIVPGGLGTDWGGISGAAANAFTLVGSSGVVQRNL